MAIKLFDENSVIKMLLDETAWDKYYSAAVEYYTAHLSLDVNARYVTEDGVRLGAWLAQLRTYRKSGVYSSYLTPERIALLDNLGMLWDVYDYVFERNYHAAVVYYHEHGDLECTSSYVTSDGIRLGAWVHYMRLQCKKNQDFLTDEQYRMLNAVGMRWGSKYDLQWDEAYAELCEYHRLNKHIDIPVAYKTASGILLGRWIRRQIESYAKGQLRSDRIERLEQLGIVWNTADAWEEKFQLAKAYSETHDGVLNVPANYVVNGVWLNKWLNEQKLIGEGKRKKQLTPEQREKLESIGLVFAKTQNDIAWQERFAETKKYYDSHGDLNVPVGYKDSLGKNLYVWLGKQREYYRVGKLSTEKVRMLRRIGFNFGNEATTEMQRKGTQMTSANHGRIIT